jgi:hypothetical protein
MALVSMKQDNILIEEKNSAGTVLRRYSRGKFLGKVHLAIFREDSPNVMS